jgi:hypothetical protein
MKTLIADRVSRLEQLPLTDNDLHFLKMRRNRLLLLLIPPYFALVSVGLYVWFSGVGSLAGKHEDEDDELMFENLAPYVIGFFLLMATIYFVKQFARSIYPLIKDINNGKKSMIYFIPARNKMAFFNKYYFSTPIFKTQQIEVAREDFENIPEAAILCLEAAPGSHIILRLCNAGKEIKFF